MAGLGTFRSGALSLREELTTYLSESYGVFKVDWSKQDSVIQRQFDIWLRARRGELLNKYDLETGIRD